MTKKEILEKYYVLTESQEEFDKVLEIFEEWKGVFTSKTYKIYGSSTYVYICDGSFLFLGDYENSKNTRNFITFDKLLDLLDNKIDLINIPILVQTREEWDSVIYYFVKHNITINFSVGCFEPNLYLVYDSETLCLEYFYEQGEPFYYAPIDYNQFLYITKESYFTPEIREEELTKDKLKDVVIKHLIRNKDVNNSYSDLLSFVNEIDKRFNLKLI